MKKFIFLVMSILIYSCISSEESIDKEVDMAVAPVVFSFQLGTTISKADITDGSVLDSLVKDIRVFVFDQDNKCEAYADFTLLQLSQTPKLKMNISLGQKKVIFVTNVCDNKVINTNYIGKKPNEIHIYLEKNKYTNSSYRCAARQFFYADIPINVQPNILNIKSVSLVRIVSQLETSVTMTKIWENKDRVDTLVYNSLQPYLYGFKAISIQYVPFQYGLDNKPDLLMGKDTISLVSEDWFNDKLLLKAKNTTLSFPTQETNTKARLLFAGLVNRNHPKFQPNSADLHMGADTIVRFWFYEMTKKINPNQRMQLNVTALIGLGAPTPIPSKHNAEVEIKISILDWDPDEYTVSGDKNDIF